jgi:hypothetical protein
VRQAPLYPSSELAERDRAHASPPLHDELTRPLQPCEEYDLDEIEVRRGGREKCSSPMPLFWQKSEENGYASFRALLPGMVLLLSYDPCVDREDASAGSKSGTWTGHVYVTSSWARGLGLGRLRTPEYSTREEAERELLRLLKDEVRLCRHEKPSGRGFRPLSR